MQCFLDGLIAQCERHRLPAEVILVDWNTPPGRRALADVLNVPPSRFCQVRFVRVPEAVHRRFAFSDRLPMFQMIAKNVGIRRAQGAFIAATNIDVLFPDALMKFLARRRLNRRRVYRADRVDVGAELPYGAGIEAQLAWCRANRLRINRRDGTWDLNTGLVTRVYPRLHRIAGHVGWTAAKLLLAESPHNLLQPAGRARFLQSWRHLELEASRRRLHTNASGDFTLASRECWHAIRGYPEWELYSFHLDSVMCHAAAAAGFRERCLPAKMCVYHIEHARGSGFVPEFQDALWDRLDHAGIGRLNDDAAMEIVLGLDAGRRAPALNDTEWGLPEDSLIGDDALVSAQEAGGAVSRDAFAGRSATVRVTAAVGKRLAESVSVADADPTEASLIAWLKGRHANSAFKENALAVSVLAATGEMMRVQAANRALTSSSVVTDFPSSWLSRLFPGSPVISAVGKGEKEGGKGPPEIYQPRQMAALCACFTACEAANVTVAGDLFGAVAAYAAIGAGASIVTILAGKAPPRYLDPYFRRLRTLYRALLKEGRTTLVAANAESAREYALWLALPPSAVATAPGL